MQIATAIGTKYELVEPSVAAIDLPAVTGAGVMLEVEGAERYRTPLEGALSGGATVHQRDPDLLEKRVLHLARPSAMLAESLAFLRFGDMNPSQLWGADTTR